MIKFNTKIFKIGNYDSKIDYLFPEMNHFIIIDIENID